MELDLNAVFFQKLTRRIDGVCALFVLYGANSFSLTTS